MAKFRYGIVGANIMGTTHARTISEYGKQTFCLTAMADIDADVVQKASKEFGVKGFLDPQEMFDSGLCDGVIIATPHYWHAPLTIQAARSGLHVLCEKPLAATVGPAQAMIQECKKNNVSLGVMFQRRTHGIMRKVKQMVDNGTIGDIFRLQMICSNWFRTQAYYDNGAWRGTWDGEGGGVLINQAPHNVDLFQWIAGMPHKLFAMTDTREHNIEVEDTANILLDYGNGKTGYIYVTTAELPGYDEFRISGEQGTVIIANGKIMFGATKKCVSKSIYETKEAFPPAQSLATEWKEVSYKDNDKMSPPAAIMANFAKHVIKGTPLIAPAENAINSLVLSNAAYLSNCSGKSIELPIDPNRIERLLSRLEKQHSSGRGGNMRIAARKALNALL